MATQESDVPTGDNGDPQDDPQPQEPQPPEAVLTLDDLPEDLRDIPRDQLPQTLRAMTRATTMGAQRIRQLEDQISEMRRGAAPSHARPSEPDVPDVEDEEDLKELILDDPEKAIMAVAKKYGLVDRLQRAEGTASDVAFIRAERDLPEFDQYQEEVEDIIRSTGAPRTFENVRGAYLMARGKRDVERLQKRQAKRTAPETPKPAPPESKKKEISPLLRDISRNMGVDEEEIDALMTDEPFSVEVPGGK